MNMRLFTVLGAVCVLGVVACSSDDTGGGSGGAGGSSTTTGTAGGSTTTSAGGTGGTSATTGGTGGTGACRSCAQWLTDAAEQMNLEPTGDPLCEESQAVWDEVVACGCEQCIDDCPAEACPGGMGTDADVCGACLGGQVTGQPCSEQVTACVNDA